MWVVGLVFGSGGKGGHGWSERNEGMRSGEDEQEQENVKERKKNEKPFYLRTFARFIFVISYHGDAISFVRPSVRPSVYPFHCSPACL